MTFLRDGETRQPVRFLNYKAAVRPDWRVPLGPNLLGELLWPVTVEPRGGGGSRLGLSYIAPEALS